MSQATAPFKFLDSYQKEDKEVFFGRETETEALYDALSGVKHLLVYGPSGAGKTSLIECGLRNQFSDADWFALTIRRGSDMTASVFARINEALQEKIPLNEETGLPIDPKTGLTDSKIDFGQAIEALFSERYQPVYLLFDQFEELLISGREEEKRDFFTRLDRLIRYKVPCRVLLIMREEFIGHLSEFEPLCPSIFQHRFRLEKMRRSAVQQVIHDMLDAPRYQAFFKVENSQSLADAILSKLPDQRQEIELAHVQVFLSELWDRADKTAARPLLHEGLVKPTDNLETVLDSFLKKQLTELEPAHGDKAPLELLAAMISERHTKLQLGEAALQQELNDKGVTLQKPLPDLLHDLERRRIVRQLKSGGVTEYEISHDVLARVVGRNLTEEMRMREDAARVYQVFEKGEGVLSKEALDQLRTYEPYRAYSEKLTGRVRESKDFWEKDKWEVLRKELKRRNWAIGAAVVGLGLALFAGLQFLKAAAATKQADLERNEAIKLREIADQKTKDAEAALRKVIEARKEKILNQIQLDARAEFHQSVAKNLRLLATVDSLEIIKAPLALILNELEK